MFACDGAGLKVAFVFAAGKGVQMHKLQPQVLAHAVVLLCRKY